MKFLDSIFDMGGGYVLDFSDRTMGKFFLEELNIDIDYVMLSKDGTSKAPPVPTAERRPCDCLPCP